MAKSSENSLDQISRKQRLLMLIPVFVLVTIALNEPRLYLQENLTSWKGGGFGMFANVDRHSYRPLIVTFTFVDRNGENRRTMQLDIRSYLDAIKNDADKSQHLEDALSLPSQHNLGFLAEQIASFKYITDQGEFAILSKEGFGVPISATQIKLEVYKLVYDDPTNTISYELLTTWDGGRR